MGIPKGSTYRHCYLCGRRVWLLNNFIAVNLNVGKRFIRKRFRHIVCPTGKLDKKK